MVHLLSGDTGGVGKNETVQSVGNSSCNAQCPTAQIIVTIQGIGNQKHVLKAPEIEKHATLFLTAHLVSPAFMRESGLATVCQNVGLS